MAATNHSWTIGDSGCGNGPSGDDPHKPGGYMDIPFGPMTTGDGYTSHLSERSDVPYEYDFHKLENVSGAPGRVDVAAGLEGYGVPAPFAGDKGQPVDFGAVAPDFEEPNGHDIDGSPGKPASGSGVLWRKGILD